MKQILTKIGITVPALALALMTLVAVPALAEGGTGSGGDDSNTSSPESGGTDGTSTQEHNGSAGSGTETGSGATTSGETGDTTTTTDHKDSTETEFHHEGLRLLEAFRHGRKEHTKAERMAFCEAHKDGIANKFSSITTAMTGFNSRIDTILTKVQAYQTDNNISVTNWDSLLSAAQAAGVTSDNSIVALKAITPSIDCNSTSVAQDIATFKAGAQQARTDLKAYKSAVKALVLALLDAKNASTEGSQN